VRFTEYSFGSVQVDGVTYNHDLIIDRGKIRKRKKAASKKFRGAYGHTPLSTAEDIPWRCRRLVIGTGADGALPVMEQVREQARRRKVDVGILPAVTPSSALVGAVLATLRADGNAPPHWPGHARSSLLGEASHPQVPVVVRRSAGSGNFWSGSELSLAAAIARPRSRPIAAVYLFVTWCLKSSAAVTFARVGGRPARRRLTSEPAGTGLMSEGKKEDSNGNPHRISR
jgi:hypothetical protein